MPYSTEAYLLDRANIHDTVTKLCLAYDLRSPSLLEESVYAPTVKVDYGIFLGRGPESYPGPEWSSTVIGFVKDFQATQHVVTGVVAELPQPGEGAERPDTCKVSANAQGNLVTDGRVRSLKQNGGRYELEMVRLEGVEGNPWRISAQKAVMLWETGTFGVFSPGRPEEAVEK